MRHTTQTPSADVLAAEDAWLLRLDLPGVRPDALSVAVEHDVLTISTSADADTPPRWYRQLTLPRDADADAIGATLRDGVLSVRIPRVGPRTRQIAIG